MSVTYATAVKNARLTATRDHFAGGQLRIMTSSDSVLVTFTLTGAGGSVSGGVWTLAFSSSTVAASASGTAAKADIRTAGASSDLTGLTVGTSGADIILDSVSINSGQNVSLTSATITHAA